MDGELSPYVAWYTSRYLEHCEYFTPPPQYEVVFEKISSRKTIAYCYRGLRGFKIAVDPNKWDRYGDVGKTHIMAHEFAHCLLKLPHDFSPSNYLYKNYTMIDYDTLNNQVIRDIRKYCPGR